MSKVEKFVSILGQKNWSFYHFTDTRNLPSIKQHGLLSTAEIRRREIAAITGGNEWSLDADKLKGMDAYVHLCFFDEHPMEFMARNAGRIEKSRFLTIKPEVLLIPGSKISKDVSNKANASYGDPEEYIEQIDLEVIYTRTDWKDKSIQERRRSAKKCEVLIPHHVPAELIRNL